MATIPSTWLRRNFDINICFSANQIYGLTSAGPIFTIPRRAQDHQINAVRKYDHPFNPLFLAMGADASFIARTMDRDPAHLQSMLLRAQMLISGASFLEIYQNGNIFNDGAFEIFTEKPARPTKRCSPEQASPWSSARRRTAHPARWFKPVIVDIDTAGTDGTDTMTRKIFIKHRY